MKILPPVEKVLIKLGGTSGLNLNALGFTFLSCILNKSFMGLIAVELEAEWWF